MRQRVQLRRGDCRDVMRALAHEGRTFDAIVTDPPYHLTTGKKGGSGPASYSEATPFGRARIGTGFMGKAWDGGDVAFQAETWRAALDVLKPGGHLLAFGGSRTYHRLACAIEDAGFELRDTICWLYGVGFPKSLDVSKAIDKAAGAKREVIGQHERANFRKGGAGFRNLDGLTEGRGALALTAPATDAAREWQGWGTALKPAFEPIIVARKPLVGTVAQNVLAHGTGALNIDASRVPAPDGVPLFSNRSGRSVHAFGDGLHGSKRTGETAPGRWPANVIHDGSDEVEEAFAAFGERTSGKPGVRRKPHETAAMSGRLGLTGQTEAGHGDTGTASRFFYSAKATKAERAGSKHPTVKPLALMRYLCKLVTPPGGTILDPFAGSGTTLQAAAECGFGAVGIELTPEYQQDIARRIAALRAA